MLRDNAQSRSRSWQASPVFSITVSRPALSHTEPTLHSAPESSGFEPLHGYSLRHHGTTTCADRSRGAVSSPAHGHGLRGI